MDPELRQLEAIAVHSAPDDNFRSCNGSCGLSERGKTIQISKSLSSCSFQCSHLSGLVLLFTGCHMIIITSVIGVM